MHQPAAREAGDEPLITPEMFLAGCNIGARLRELAVPGLTVTVCGVTQDDLGDVGRSRIVGPSASDLDSIVLGERQLSAAIDTTVVERARAVNPRLADRRIDLCGVAPAQPVAHGLPLFREHEGGERMSEPWRSTLGRRLYIALGVLVTLAGVLVVVVCVGTVIMLGAAAFDVRRVASHLGSDAVFLITFAIVGGVVAAGGVSMWDGPRGNKRAARPGAPIPRRRH